MAEQLVLNAMTKASLVPELVMRRRPGVFTAGKLVVEEAPTTNTLPAGSTVTPYPISKPELVPPNAVDHPMAALVPLHMICVRKVLVMSGEPRPTLLVRPLYKPATFVMV